MALTVRPFRRPGVAVAAPAAAVVGMATGVIVARNQARHGLLLTLVSAGQVAFGLGQDAVLNAGINLFGQGAVWEMDELSFTTEPISAVADEADRVLAIQEF